MLTHLIPSRPTVVALATCLVIWAWTASSDDRKRDEPGHRIPVAVIDISKVFKQARGFNASMNRMKAAVEEFDRSVKGKKVEIDSLRPKGDSGSAPDSGAATSAASEKSAALVGEVTAKRAVFLAEEAAVYASVYQDIENVVQKICRDRDIGLVIRCQMDPIDAKDRSSVLQGVNRPVIYSAVPDLTADVVATLNRDN